MLSIATSVSDLNIDDVIYSMLTVQSTQGLIELIKDRRRGRFFNLEKEHYR